MPSEKAMAKSAKIIKAAVNEKHAEKVSGSDEETSSDGTSSSGSDDDATSSSGSDSGSESESDSEDDDLPTEIAKPTPSKATSTPKKIVPAKTNTAAPPAPFQPPKGFEPLKTTSEPKASKILSQSKLAGKQIWYITAPASVPITTIKSVSLRDVQKGKPVATIDGQNYGFTNGEGLERDNTKLLVPSREGERYEVSKRSIDQVLHLQQIVQLPELMTKEKATVPAAKKFVRQQPKGLRMRFKPIGFGDEAPGKIGESDDECDVNMEDAPRAFKKHKVAEESDAEAISRKSKKDKEKKKDKKEKKEKKEKKSKA